MHFLHFPANPLQRAKVLQIIYKLSKSCQKAMFIFSCFLAEFNFEHPAKFKLIQSSLIFTIFYKNDLLNCLPYAKFKT